MSREQLSYLLRLVKGGMLERATTMIEQELVKSESHIVKWSIPVDPNNFGEPLAQPEQELTEEGKAWGEMAKKMSRDFMENAKKNWEPPPKDVDTITMTELRNTDLYRKVQIQLLRDILRDYNT
jgi:hypothetical protein